MSYLSWAQFPMCEPFHLFRELVHFGVQLLFRLSGILFLYEKTVYELKDNMKQIWKKKKMLKLRAFFHFIGVYTDTAFLYKSYKIYKDI